MNNKNKIYLILIYFFAITAIAFFYFDVSSDLWWHISSGKQIISNKVLPEIDNFYCVGEYKWYNHEWLFDVISFLIYNKTGKYGIKIFYYLIFVITIFLILFNSYFLSLKNIDSAFIITSLSLFFLLPFTEERPQLFTILFFSFFIYFCANKFNNINFIWLFLLGILFLIWVNIHYTVTAAIYVLLIYTIFSGKNLKGLLLNIFFILVLIFISALNPDGIKIFNFFSKDLWLKQYIREWQGLLKFSDLNFLIYQIVYFLTGIFITIYIIKKYNNISKIDVLKQFFILFPFFISGIFSKKIILFFAISFPIISIFFSDIKIKKMTFILLYILFILISFLSLSNKVNINYPYNIIKNIKTKIYNECIFSSFEIGGFVEFFSYPENKVFLNGRLNAKKEILYDYSAIYHCEENFKDVIKKYNLKIFLIDRNSPLFKYFILNNIKPMNFEKGYGLFIVK